MSDKNKDINTDMKIGKDKLVKREIARLTNLFKDVERNRRLAAKGLIEEVAFMKATLSELKELVNENGAIDIMPQGDYSIKREEPALKSYNTMIQRYANALKQLSDMLPKEVAKEISEGDGFDQFINNRAD